MINNKNNRQYLESIMEKVGLDPKSKKHVGKYSMGMRQRLAIAQSIMEEPEFLVLDEPFNGLDSHGVNEMRELKSRFFNNNSNRRKNICLSFPLYTVY